MTTKYVRMVHYSCDVVGCTNYEHIEETLKPALMSVFEDGTVLCRKHTCKYECYICGGLQPVAVNAKPPAGHSVNGLWHCGDCAAYSEIMLAAIALERMSSSDGGAVDGSIQAVIRNLLDDLQVNRRKLR